MTDKQIIIDGVDVSGCKCYSEHREGYCGWYTPCEGDTCPYKLKWALQQLKAKEQECEELKEELNGIEKLCRTNAEKFINKYDQLKAANEKLKLKQITKEIKEIVSKHYKTEEELFKIRHSRLPKFSMGALNGRHNLALEILQKIKEVENESNI